MRPIRLRSARAATRIRSPCRISSRHSDVIFGIGCSFTESSFAITIPRDKVLIHSTNDPMDLAKCLPTQHGLIGDARAHPARPARSRAQER